MDDDVRRIDRPPETVCVQQVADDDLGIELLQEASPLQAPDQESWPDAVVAELPGDLVTDEAGSPCHQDPHVTPPSVDLIPCDPSRTKLQETPGRRIGEPSQFQSFSSIRLTTSSRASSSASSMSS